MSPRRACFECAAMKPSAVMPSSIGSSGGPTPRIWKKWSMTQIESKPTSSAVRTTRAKVSASSRAPPGQVKELICRPAFIEPETLAEEVHVRGQEGVADRRGVAPRESRTANQGHRPARHLAERELRGRGELVGDSADGRPHRPAVCVGRAPEIVDGVE